MNTIRKTDIFRTWLSRLRDHQARQRILGRIRRAAKGNFGDHHAVGDGVSEMRIDYGPGYRVYYAQEGATVYLLLLGGDKRTQDADIDKARDLWLTMRRK